MARPPRHSVKAAKKPKTCNAPEFYEGCRVISAVQDYHATALLFLADFNAEHGCDLRYRHGQHSGHHRYWFMNEPNELYDLVSDAALEVRVFSWLANCLAWVSEKPRPYPTTKSHLKEVMHALKLIALQREDDRRPRTWGGGWSPQAPTLRVNV